MDSNLTASDILALNKDDGLGSGWLIIILLFLIGGGGFFGNNRNTNATTNDVVYTSAFNQLQDENRNIVNEVQRTAYESMGTTKDVAYNNLSELRDIQAQTSLGFANMANQINTLGKDMEACCCNLKTQMLQDKYDAAQAQLVQAQNVISNQVQTQNILNSIGRFAINPSVPPYPYYGNYGGNTII